MAGAHAALHQPAGHQALPTKHVGGWVVDTVELSGAKVLARQVKHLGCLTLHAESQFKGADTGIELTLVGAVTLVDVVELAEGIELLTQAAPFLVRAGVQVGDGVFQVAHQCALVGTGQETRGPQLRPLEDLRRADHHKPWQVLVLGPQTISQPRTHAGPGKSLLARAHLQCRARMVDVVGPHGTDNTDIVDARGQAGQQLAHRGSRLAMLVEFPRRSQQIAGFGALQLRLGKRERFAVVGGQARLGIEQVDMRWATRHVQENHPFGLGHVVRPARRQRRQHRGRRHGFGLGHQVGQGQQAKAGAGVGKHLAS